MKSKKTDRNAYILRLCGCDLCSMYKKRQLFLAISPLDKMKKVF